MKKREVSSFFQSAGSEAQCRSEREKKQLRWC